MSDDSKALGASAECNRDGPDYFGYYARQAAELLSQDESFQLLTSPIPELPARGLGEVKGVSLFSDGIHIGLSDFQRERLKALLRQSVVVLTAEADEMLCPVVKASKIQTQRRKKRSLRASQAESEDDESQPPSKKLKLSSSDPSTSLPQLSSATKNSACGNNAETVKSTNGPDESKGNDDLQFVLENDSSELDKIMTKFCDELYAKLGHMEQQLEKLLDAVTSTCRPMVLAEKKQLQKMIKGLPRENLDRVAELIERNKPADERSDDEIHVDLEKENIGTLWRLYYCIKAVEKARKLSL